MASEKFKVLNRWSDKVQFEAEIECESDAVHSWKLRLAVLWAIKSGADMSGADMSGANMSGANMYRANMSRADMYRADMYRANMSRADMSGANMSGADMSGANMSGANMSGANMSGANMSGANMSGANMSGAKGLAVQPPQTKIIAEGDLIVYKKLREGVCTLSIDRDTPRSNATGRKCRAKEAKVLSLPAGVSEGTSTRDPKFKYRLNEIVKCHEWSDKWYEECAGGIHFFLTREEAEAYN